MNHLITIGQKLLEGVMFHSDMADSFQFLGLEGFAQWQSQQMENELKELNCLKNYAITHYHMLLDLREAKQEKQIIPTKWYTQSALNVEAVDIVNNLKELLTCYISWEQEVIETIQNQLGNKDDEIVKEMLQSAECELEKVITLRQRMQITNYNLVYIQLLQK